VPGVVSMTAAVFATHVRPHSPMSPAPMSTSGVPGAATAALKVSEPVSLTPMGPRALRRSAYCPTAVYV